MKRKIQEDVTGDVIIQPEPDLLYAIVGEDLSHRLEQMWVKCWLHNLVAKEPWGVASLHPRLQFPHLCNVDNNAWHVTITT